MPQNPAKYNVTRLKGTFNRALPLEKFNQLVNFVGVKKVLAECPGDYVCYRFYYNGVAVATSEPNIDEWLELHNKTPRGTVKPTYNKTGIQAQQTGQNGYSKSFGADAMVNTETLQEQIMHKLNAGGTLTSIADELGCTAANIYYHRKKYNERMNKQLEVDN